MAGRLRPPVRYMRSVFVLVAVALVLLVGCEEQRSDPAFESASVSVFAARGGDCFEHRCVIVTASVVGTRDGRGSCAVFGPGDADSPIVESGPLEMTPGEDTIWTAVQLPDDAPPIAELRATCTPTSDD